MITKFNLFESKKSYQEITKTEYDELLSNPINIDRRDISYISNILDEYRLDLIPYNPNAFSSFGKIHKIRYSIKYKDVFSKKNNFQGANISKVFDDWFLIKADLPPGPGGSNWGYKYYKCDQLHGLSDLIKENSYIDFNLDDW